MKGRRRVMVSLPIDVGEKRWPAEAENLIGVRSRNNWIRRQNELLVGLIEAAHISEHHILLR